MSFLFLCEYPRHKLCTQFVQFQVLLQDAVNCRLRHACLLAEFLNGLSLVGCKGVLDVGNLGSSFVGPAWAFPVCCTGCHVTRFESVEPLSDLSFAQHLFSENVAETSPNLDWGVACLLEHLDHGPLLNSASQWNECHPQKKDKKQRKHLA